MVDELVSNPEFSKGSFIDLRRDAEGRVKFWREEDGLVLEDMKHLFDITLNIDEIKLFVDCDSVSLLSILKKDPVSWSSSERIAVHDFDKNLPVLLNRLKNEGKSRVVRIINNREELYTFLERVFPYVNFLEQQNGFLESQIVSLKEEIIEYRIALASKQSIIAEKPKDKVDPLPIEKEVDSFNEEVVESKPIKKDDIPDYLG